MLGDDVLKKLDALSLRFREHARGGAGGVRRSRALGSSAEFSDFREYAPGDDIRRIDWNAYARFDKLFLKLFMEEQETVVNIALDASASMEGKWQLAVDAAQVVAYLALTGGDRVRLHLLRGDKATTSPPYVGRSDFYHVARFLGGESPRGRASLNNAAASIEPLGRGLCVLISDLLAADGYERGIGSLLYRRQEVSLIHILSESELDPSLEGAVRLIDSEDGSSVDLMAGSEALRRYRAALETFLKDAKSYCHRHSITYIRAIAREGALADLLRSLMEAGAAT